MSVLDFVSDTGEVDTQVAVGCYETADGTTQTTVELFDGGRRRRAVDLIAVQQLGVAVPSTSPSVRNRTRSARNTAS